LAFDPFKKDRQQNRLAICHLKIIDAKGSEIGPIEEKNGNFDSFFAVRNSHNLTISDKLSMSIQFDIVKRSLLLNFHQFVKLHSLSLIAVLAHSHN